MTAPHHPALGDVSCRITGYTIQHLVRMGLPTAPLTAGLPYTLDELQVPSASIPWDDYLVFLRNTYAAVTTDQLFQMCSQYSGSPHLRPFLSAAGLWFHPARYYEWIAGAQRGTLHHLFRCLETRCTRVGAGAVLITEELRAGYELPPALFWQCQATGLAALTAHFGLAQAVVAWEPTERGAVFRVRLPHRRPVRFILSWLASFFRRETSEDLRTALAHGHERSLRLEAEIAERKRAEAARAQSEERLWQITAAIPGVVYQYWLAPDGRQGFTFVSGGAAGLTGYSPEELITSPELIWERILPGSAPGVRESVRRSAREGTPWREEFQFRTKSGTVRWVRGNAVPEPAEGSGRVVWNGLLMDITAERAAAEALAASEQRLAEVAKNLPGVLFQLVLGPDGAVRVGYVSAGIAALLGRTPDELMRPDLDPFELVHADQRESARRGLLESAAALNEWTFEGMVHRTDEGHSWLRARATPSRTPAGETVWNGVALDVSEHKRTEERAREHAARLEALTATSIAHIHELDRAGVIRYCNRASAGRTVDELIGRPLAEVLHPADRDRFPAVLGAVFETGDPFRGEITVADGTGDERVYSVVISPIRAGRGIDRVVLTGFDITDRVRAEETVRRSEERFRRLVENGNEVVALYDAEGTILYESPAAERVKGFAPAELVGTSSIALVHPDDLHLALGSLGRILERRGAAVRLELRSRCKDGSYRWLDFVATNQLHDPAIRAIVGNYRDITAWRAANERLRESAELLRKLSEQVPGVIFQYRQWPDGRSCFPYASEGIRAIYEVAPEEVRASAEVVFTRLHPDDYGAVVRSITHSREALEEWRRTYRVRLPERGERWLEGHSVPERLPDGSTLWHGYIGDVTERTRAEGALRESEERFRALFDAAPNANTLTDEAGRYVAVNEAFTAATGRTAEQVIGKTRAELGLLPADYQPVYDAARARLASAGRIENREVTLAAPGGPRTFLYSMRRVRIAGVVQDITSAIDITRLKETEAALRESEGRFRTLIGDLDVGVVVLGPDDRITLSNPAAARVLGLSAEQLHGLAARDPRWEIVRADGTPYGPEEIPFAVVARTREPLANMIVGGRNQATGARIWLQVNATPRLNPDGALLHVILTFVDVTERKRIEDDLRVKDAAIAGSTNAIALADLDGRVNYANASFLEMWGYDRADQVLGRPVPEFWEPTGAPERIMAELRAGRPWRGELRGLRRDGALFDAQVSANLVLDRLGRPTHLMGSFVDVTALKRAEEDRRAAEQFAQRVAEIVPNVLYVFDLAEQRNVFTNRAAEHLLGYPAAELAQLLASDPTALMHPDDRPGFLAHTRRLGDLKDGEVPTFEYRMRRADGSWAWFLSRDAVFARNPDGTVRSVLGSATEISSQKRAEEQLRIREDRLQQAVRCAEIGIFDHNHQTGEIHWSPLLRSICGWTAEPPPTLAEYLAAVHPDDAERIRAAVRRAHDPDGDGSYDVELRLSRFNDGAVRWLLTRSKTVFEGDGAARHPVRSFGAIMDVTGRRRAEEALRESEERWKFALEGAGTGVLDWDVSTDRMLVSDRWREMTGYPPARVPLSGAELKALVHPDDRPAAVADLEATLAAHKAVHRAEHRLRCADGTWIWVESRALVTRRAPDRAPLRMIGTHTDVTERKRAEAALREAEARQRLALDTGRMGTWEWEIGTDRLHWDAREQELFGLRPGTYDGRLSTALALVHPEDRSGIDRLLAGAAAGAGFDGEFRILLPSGAVRWIHGTGAVVRGPDGRPERFVGINYDITDRKRTEELQVAALREKEALLKEIHHRVKNNLQVISSLLNLQAERITDPGARSIFLESQSRVRAMALVHETLYGSESLARIELPRYLERLCTSLLRTYGGADRIAIQRQMAGVSLDLDRALPAGLIISELVSNALKYAFPNGRPGLIVVSVTGPSEGPSGGAARGPAGTEPVCRTADARTEGPGEPVARGGKSNYTLSVHDDGVGLPADFDLDRTSSLGLYLVRVLARQLRGELDVDRSAGTTFSIRFPV
jgi:PAS domain S-box-containing protein